MKPSVLTVLLPDLRGGGAERVMIHLARELARTGHRVEFALMRAQGDFLPEAQKQFPVHDLAVRRVRQVPTALAGYLRRNKPDAVIANMWPLTSAAVIGRALSLHRCHLLLLEHTVLTQQYASWGRRHGKTMAVTMAATYRFADTVAAVSKGAAIDLARLARIPASRVQVLNNPVPQYAQPHPEEIKAAESLWDCPRGQRILTVGRFTQEKNHALLLRAFAKMPKPGARLLFLGKGPDEIMLRALASELEIADSVIFPGFFPNPASFYATADLFVLSSDYEGLPTVLIEALSFGVPVVSTDCPFGPAEILGNNQYGTLTPVGDPEALARALTDALDAPVDAAALRQRAADFAPEVIGSKYLNLLHSVEGNS